MYLTAHGLSFNITPTGRFFGKIPEPWDILKDIELVRRSGFEGYELWVEKLLSYMVDGSNKQLADTINAAGIRVPAFCFVGDFPDMGIHTAEPDKAWKLFETLQAIECGVGVYVVDPYEGLSREDAMEKACAKLQEVADVAVDYGIKLAIEFIYTLSYLHSIADAIELMERAGRDNVGISVDTFHFHMGGSKFEDIAKIPAGKIYSVHVNSCPDKPKEEMTDKDRLPPGLGVLPFGEILDACRAQGYNEHLTVEILHDDYWKLDPEAAIRKIYEETRDAVAKWCL